MARGTLALALEQMDPDARLVLALLHVEKLTVEEAAAALGIECADVARTAERARLWLSNRVEERFTDGCEGRAA